MLGGILSEVLQHFAGYTIDPVSATAIVVALGAAFGVIFHGVDKYGLRGIGVRVWRGQQLPPAAVPSAVVDKPAATVEPVVDAPPPPPPPRVAT